MQAAMQPRAPTLLSSSSRSISSRCSRAPCAAPLRRCRPAAAPLVCRSASSGVASSSSSSSSSSPLISGSVSSSSSSKGEEDGGVLRAPQQPGEQDSSLDEEDLAPFPTTDGLQQYYQDHSASEGQQQQGGGAQGGGGPGPPLPTAAAAQQEAAVQAALTPELRPKYKTVMLKVRGCRLAGEGVRRREAAHVFYTPCRGHPSEGGKEAVVCGGLRGHLLTRNARK